jgi:hypothetical protein
MLLLHAMEYGASEEECGQGGDGVEGEDGEGAGGAKFVGEGYYEGESTGAIALWKSFGWAAQECTLVHSFEDLGGEVVMFGEYLESRCGKTTIRGTDLACLRRKGGDPWSKSQVVKKEWLAW